MTTIRIKLPKISEVDFQVFTLPEDCAIEGNVSAIDPETDKKIADNIREQLDNGNEWAWCTVKVECHYKGFTGEDYLGCCSFNSYQDFIKNSGYYEDMKKQAYASLISALKSLKS